MSKYLIFGYGGISSEVIKKLLIDEPECQITAVTRKNNISDNKIKVIRFEQLDSHINETGLPDYIINTIGALHDENHMPEKSIPQISNEWLHKSIDINTVPTIQIAQAINKHIKRDTDLKFMIISAIDSGEHVLPRGAVF